MNKKVAPRVQLNFAPEVEEIDEPEITLSNESLPVEVPQVIERDEIIENDIFDAVDKIKPKVVKEKLKDDSEIIIDEQSEDEIEAPTPVPRPRKTQAKQTQAKQTQVKQEKKKRQLSEEHKAKLALAREKALATRRAKAEEKKKMKEIETKTKELKKKKAVKDLEELEEEVTKPVKSAPLQGQSSMFTKQDLEEAQLQAIMNYEKIRKARKEEKKQQQMIDQQKKDLQKKIQGYGARDSNGRLLNKWDRCY